MPHAHWIIPENFPAQRLTHFPCRLCMEDNLDPRTALSEDRADCCNDAHHQNGEDNKDDHHRFVK